MPNSKIYLNQIYNEMFLSRVKHYANVCEKKIGGNDIKILIENTNVLNDISLRAIEYLLKKDCFGLTLDVGHNFCEEGYGQKFLEKYHNKVIHLHLHDANERQNHLEIGSGKIQFDKILKQYSRATAVIEVKTVEGLKRSIEMINKIKISANKDVQI